MHLPTYLYHGSMFDIGSGVLQPGFNYTGELVEWDKTESNRFLYATTVSRTAIELGIGSLLEKEFNASHFTVDGKIISVGGIDVDERQNILIGKSVYLYTIRVRPEHNWVKNNNPHNRIDTEWKTEKTISQTHGGISKSRIDVAKWLSDNCYNVLYRK